MIDFPINKFAWTRERNVLGDAILNTKDFFDYLSKCPELKKFTPVGSFRRKTETVGDIDIVAYGSNHKKIIDYFTNFPKTLKILKKDDDTGIILLKDDLKIEIQLVDQREWIGAIQYYTGSIDHNKRLKEIASNKNILFGPHGLMKNNGLLKLEDENNLYQNLGLPYIPPELREDRGEIEAALNQKLPSLLVDQDIQGDLHIHSKWSDGEQSIEENVRAAIDKGYQYLAITDHSPAVKLVPAPTALELKEKKKEIEALNAKYPLKILTGTEVDIMPDGSIDYPDEVLKELDYVIASIHNGFRKDNTERILKAMENKYVHTIAHLSGRLMGVRRPYPLDYRKIFEKAAETGTWLEINSQRLRLDMTDIQVRKAKELGIKFTISTDCHRVENLWMMELGVSVARRGWLTKDDIINTLSFSELKEALKQKRNS